MISAVKMQKSVIVLPLGSNVTDYYMWAIPQSTSDWLVKRNALS